MIITFENLPKQRFSTVINDIDYTLELNYNVMYEFWSLDIETNDFNLYGIKLVAGIDLVYQYPEVPFSMISVGLTDPTRDDIEFFKLEVL